MRAVVEAGDVADVVDASCQRQPAGAQRLGALQEIAPRDRVRQRRPAARSIVAQRIARRARPRAPSPASRRARSPRACCGSAMPSSSSTGSARRCSAIALDLIRQRRADCRDRARPDRRTGTRAMPGQIALAIADLAVGEVEQRRQVVGARARPSRTRAIARAIASARSIRRPRSWKRHAVGPPHMLGRQPGERGIAALERAGAVEHAALRVGNGASSSRIMSADSRSRDPSPISRAWRLIAATRLPALAPPSRCARTAVRSARRSDWPGRAPRPRRRSARPAADRVAAPAPRRHRRRSNCRAARGSRRAAPRRARDSGRARRNCRRPGWAACRDCGGRGRVSDARQQRHRRRPASAPWMQTSADQLPSPITAARGSGCSPIRAKPPGSTVHVAVARRARRTRAA